MNMMTKDTEQVVLYDNQEAWIIKKHKTKHINKDCKYFMFDGFIQGCSHKLSYKDSLDLKKVSKHFNKWCDKNCKYKRSKNYITLKEAIGLEVDKLKKEWEKISYTAAEIHRLEIEKTCKSNDKC